MASNDMTETQALNLIARQIADVTVIGKLNVFQSVEDTKKAMLAFNTLGHLKAAEVLKKHLDSTVKCY